MPSATLAAPAPATAWQRIGTLDDIEPGTGAAALVGRRQVAVFRPAADGPLYALANFDPFGRAMVLARGLLGEHQGAWFVASPLHKQRFRLVDGVCLDDPAVSVPSYPVRVADGGIDVAVPA